MPHTGKIISHTLSYESMPGFEYELPMSIGLIKLDNGVNIVSQLVDSASGVHPRWSDYYIRRYRIAARDPLFKMLKKQGFPCKPENGQTKRKASTWVLSFPVKAPEGCVKRADVTALDQLKH